MIPQPAGGGGDDDDVVLYGEEEEGRQQAARVREERANNVRLLNIAEQGVADIYQVLDNYLRSEASIQNVPDYLITAYIQQVLHRKRTLLWEAEIAVELGNTRLPSQLPEFASEETKRRFRLQAEQDERVRQELLNTGTQRRPKYTIDNVRRAFDPRQNSTFYRLEHRRFLTWLYNIYLPPRVRARNGIREKVFGSAIETARERRAKISNRLVQTQEDIEATQQILANMRADIRAGYPALTRIGKEYLMTERKMTEEQISQLGEYAVRYVGFLVIYPDFITSTRRLEDFKVRKLMNNQSKFIKLQKEIRKKYRNDLSQLEEREQALKNQLVDADRAVEEFGVRETDENERRINFQMEEAFVLMPRVPSEDQRKALIDVELEARYKKIEGLWSALKLDAFNTALQSNNVGAEERLIAQVTRLRNAFESRRLLARPQERIVEESEKRQMQRLRRAREEEAEESKKGPLEEEETYVDPRGKYYEQIKEWVDRYGGEAAFIAFAKRIRLDLNNRAQMNDYNIYRNVREFVREYQGEQKEEEIPELPMGDVSNPRGRYYVNIMDIIKKFPLEPDVINRLVDMILEATEPNQEEEDIIMMLSSKEVLKRFFDIANGPNGRKFMSDPKLLEDLLEIQRRLQDPRGRYFSDIRDIFNRYANQREIQELRARIRTDDPRQMNNPQIYQEVMDAVARMKQRLSEAKRRKIEALLLGLGLGHLVDTCVMDYLVLY